MSTIETTEATTVRIEDAHRILREDHPRMGEYAHDIIDGRRALSGADLRGAAKRYGGTYRRAREAALDAAEAAGGHIRRGDHGRLTLEWVDVPEDAELSECALGYCWVY